MAVVQAGSLTRTGKFSRIMVTALLLSLGALLYIERYSSIDLAFADLMFDPATRKFLWRHAWITAKFGHDILKIGLVSLGIIPILLCCYDLFFPLARWTGSFRLRMRIVALSAMAVPLSISLLKSISSTHCPWDLERYGGFAPYVRLLDAIPDGLVWGHCFPAGHASGALWMISIAIFWWPHRPGMSALVGFLTLVFGFGVGWIQQMRGAHFLSHTLWSAWIACALVFLIASLANRTRHIYQRF